MSVASARSRIVFRVLALSAACLVAACGKTLGTLTEQAMDGCMAVRNPQFKAGQGATALETPLPDSIRTAAGKLAYARAFVNFERITEIAGDQATLFCALELASFYKNGDVAVLLYKYARHPDAGVAMSARRLLKTQDPLPAAYLRAAGVPELPADQSAPAPAPAPAAASSPEPAPAAPAVRAALPPR
jgi:hypothetical protein